MNADEVTIECHYHGWVPLFFLSDQAQYEKLGYEVASLGGFDQEVTFTLDERKVKINVWRPAGNRDVDVCVVRWFVDRDDFIDEVKREERRYKHKWPTTPIIVVGDAWWKNDPKSIKKAELEGRKFINRKMWNKLARKIGANKYVEFSRKSERGIKIVFDEIVYAYFAKLKDEEERRESETREKEEIERNKLIEKERQVKLYRDILFFLVFACLMVIISIIVHMYMR